MNYFHLLLKRHVFSYVSCLNSSNSLIWSFHRRSLPFKSKLMIFSVQYVLCSRSIVVFLFLLEIFFSFHWLKITTFELQLKERKYMENKREDRISIVSFYKSMDSCSGNEALSVGLISDPTTKNLLRWMKNQSGFCYWISYVYTRSRACQKDLGYSQMYL